MIAGINSSVARIKSGEPLNCALNASVDRQQKSSRGRWLLVSLAWLPFPLAYATVTVLNLLCLALTLRLLLRRLALGSDQTFWLLLLAFCAVPVYVTLFHGQTSFLALLLLTLYVLDLQEG